LIFLNKEVLVKSNKNIKEVKNDNLGMPKSSKDVIVSHNIKSKEILSFGGTFNNMTKDDYDEYLNNAQKTRLKLFDRNFDT
jgi:hypothetical protein